METKVFSIYIPTVVAESSKVRVSLGYLWASKYINCDEKPHPNAGITNFWCSSFVLPKTFIKRINSLCGVFCRKETLKISTQQGLVGRWWQNRRQKEDLELETLRFGTNLVY